MVESARTLASGGSSTVDSLNAGSLSIDAGTFTVNDHPSADSPNTVNSVSMALSGGVPVGTLDLRNNQLTIHYGTGASPLSTVQALIQSGYHGGDWTGPGITSSTAAARYTSGPTTALGYADDGAGNINIMYTLAGDANLDGIVNSGDLAIMAAHYGMTGQDWADGDFNYDGIVNSADIGILSANYGAGIGATPDIEVASSQSFTGEFAPLLEFAEEVGDLPQIEAIVDAREGVTDLAYVSTPTSVPEPASVGMLGLIGAMVLGPRRRKAELLP